MKKFAITSFAVLYAVLIVSVTAERTSDWARQAAALVHSCSGHHLPGIGQPDKSETYLSQKKLVEPEFVVESPREAVAVPVQCERLTLLSSFEYHATWSDQPFSSRAPPSYL